MSSLPILFQTKWKLPTSLRSGLIEWWPLSESSGTRTGLLNEQNLTDNNGVSGAMGVNAEFVSSFLASGHQYLERTSNSLLRTGNISQSFCCWFRFDSFPSTAILISKDSVASLREYNISYDLAAGGIRWLVFNGSDAIVGDITAIFTPTTSTWYFAVAWFDVLLGKVFIQINNQTVFSANTSGSVGVSTSHFRIGDDTFSSSRSWNGKIGRAAMWKRVLTVEERAYLYNNGNGLTY